MHQWPPWHCLRRASAEAPAVESCPSSSSGITRRTAVSVITIATIAIGSRCVSSVPSERTKAIRRFAKVGQFQKLDQRLRSVGASVMRKLGGPDRLAQPRAQETKTAVHAGKNDRFVINAMNSLLRLQLFDAEQKVKERDERDRAERTAYATMTDDQVKGHVARQLESHPR